MINQFSYCKDLWSISIRPWSDMKVWHQCLKKTQSNWCWSKGLCYLGYVFKLRIAEDFNVCWHSIRYHTKCLIQCGIMMTFVDTFIKEFNGRLAGPPLKFNGGLDNLGIFLSKAASCGINVGHLKISLTKLSSWKWHFHHGDLTH